MKLEKNELNFYDPISVLGVESDDGFGSAPKYDGSGKLRIIQNFEKFKSYYVQACGAGLRDYKSYQRKLKNNGFKLHDCSSSNRCRFSTYTDGYNIVNLSYVEYKTPVELENAKIGDTVSYINVAIESVLSSALPPKKTTLSAITTPLLVMLNTQPAFLFRMRDGRFIFIDGGVDGINDRTHADLFFEQIKAYNVGVEKPVIAAWIITHPHADHLAGFIRTIQKHGDKFIVERILCNFQGEETISSELGKTMETEGPYNYKWQMCLYNEIVSKHPEIQLVTVHTGQKFVFEDLTVEILFTPENLYRPFEVGNDASVIYNLKTKGGRFIVTGDAQQINTKLTQAIHGKKLKAELLQLAHHGYRARNVEFYAAVGAKYGIWTNSWEAICEQKERMFNKPSYNGVDPCAKTKILIPTVNEPIFLLSPEITAAELKPYVRNEELASYKGQE